MKYFPALISTILVTLLFFPSPIFAVSPTLVINFASINELNWAAPEPQWQQAIKPQAMSEVRQMQQTLSPKEEGSNHLAWSTLMEYMNFPLDTPSPTSPYVIKTHRIFEIARELNLPVFLPLNGFQWWDQLPELYNWWDPDGTHTDPKFFARQKNPTEFKQRFIAGYNPDNKWNVEWQSATQPMQLNYRNWGGGGFRLAPPPNILPHTKAPLTFRQVNEARLRAITNAIASEYNQLKAEHKENLFVGLSIGTEVSLNASITPADEFKPYGYRAIFDQDPTASPSSYSALRQSAVRSYLTDLSRLSVKAGIPKDYIYTHVWSESVPGEPRYENYAAAAFNLYSNPGISLYGFADNPLSLPTLKEALAATHYPHWGAIEYSAGPTQSRWQQGLTHLFNNPQNSADLTVVYNWQEHSHTPAVNAMKAFLKSPPHSTCETFSAPPYTLHVQKGIVASLSNPDVYTATIAKVPPTLPNDLPPGNYVWYTTNAACERMVYSQPEPIRQDLKVDTTLPKWIEFLLNHGL